MPQVNVDYLRLIDDSTGEELNVLPAVDNGRRIFIEDLDFGFPIVREDMTERSQGYGADDYTMYYGARAVSLVVKIVDQEDVRFAETLAELGGWMSPRRRIRMLFSDPGMPDRQMTLRAGNFQGPATRKSLQSGTTDVQLQWVCASGQIESQQLFDEFIARDDTLTLGRTYPLTYPRDYPDRGGIGAQLITNQGKEPVYPLVRVHGPSVGQILTNETTGRTIQFADDFSIAAGSYVELDMKNRTAQLNGIPGSNDNMRGELIKFDWWTLESGDNLIRYFAASGSSPTQAELLWRSAWLR